VDGKPTVLRTIRSRDASIAELDADLFERDLPIQPGEVYRCTVVGYFRNCGTLADPPFVVVAGLGGTARAIRIETPPIRVVPSLLAETQVVFESICTYDTSTKLDVTLTHVGHTTFENFQLTVGPATAILAGISDQRKPAFAPGDTIKFTTVVAAVDVELTFDGTASGERVGPVSKVVHVPPVQDTATRPLFRFLEPKKLTEAKVTLRTLDDEPTLIPQAAGVHDVRGGGTKYRVEIRPTHPQASKVRLSGLSGSVEVTELPANPGTWAFQMVVLSNGVFTAPVALHYDVATPEGPQQGELNLAVRPSSTKLWLVAVTAGAAITVKGVAAVVPAIFSPGDVLDSLGAALTRVDTLWDVLQFLSIPFIRVGLWFADKVACVFQDS